MSDATGAAPTAPEAPQTAEPAAPPAAPADPAAGSATTPSHPSWDRVLDQIPTPWQKPIRDEIANQEREFQKALEKARADATPEEWRQLIAEAGQHGLDPDTLVDAYNGQLDMQQELMSDPDAFLANMSAFIEAQVAAGAITRKAGAQAQKQVEAAAAEAGAGDLYQSPEAKALAEMQKRLDDRDAADQQRQQQEQEAEQQRQQQAAAQQHVQAFTAALDTELESTGLITKNEQGVLVANVPNAMLKQIALQADALLDADQRVTVEQAVKSAVQQFTDAAKQMGMQLPAAGATRPGVPPVLGGASQGAPAPVAPNATRAEKSAAAVEAIRATLGQSA